MAAKKERKVGMSPVLGLPFGFKEPKDMNDIAVQVTLLEGQKESLSVAQVKEVLSELRKLCHRNEPTETLVIQYFSKKRAKERSDGPGRIAKRKLAGN